MMGVDLKFEWSWIQCPNLIDIKIRVTSRQDLNVMFCQCGFVSPVSLVLRDKYLIVWTNVDVHFAYEFYLRLIRTFVNFDIFRQEI